jgi:SAM-dependent methyltransferase
MNADGWLEDTRTSYDTVAVSYADLVRDSLDGATYLRSALALFADLVRADGGGPVADVGCGPGQVTALLHELGTDAFGIDLSPAMIDLARRDHPGLRFEVGSMTDLRLANASVAGLLAFWSLIHIPDETVPSVFSHFRRVLRPGGPLLVGFHAGDGARLKTQGYGGHPMKVRVHRRQPSQVAAWLRDAGFTIEAQMLIDPDESVPGAIIFARRPADVLRQLAWTGTVRIRPGAGRSTIPGAILCTSAAPFMTPGGEAPRPGFAGRSPTDRNVIVRRQWNQPSFGMIWSGDGPQEVTRGRGWRGGSAGGGRGFRARAGP